MKIMKRFFVLLILMVLPEICATADTYSVPEGYVCPDCGGVLKVNFVSSVSNVTESTDNVTSCTCQKCCFHFMINDDSGDLLTEVNHCDWDDGTVITESTCTEKGIRMYTCKTVSSHKRTQEIPATGHTPVTDPAVAPTETKTGLTEGSHCSVCGAILKAQEVIPVTGKKDETPEEAHGETHTHTVVIDPAVTATCTMDGLSEGSHCSACGEIIKAQEKIPAGHTVVTDLAVAATCAKKGLTEGTHCSACGTVLTAQKETPALGHLWVKWDADGDWTHTIKCARGCGEKRTVNCTAMALPVMTADGNGVSFCPVCGYCEGAALTAVKGVKLESGAPRNASLRVFSVDLDGTDSYIVITFEQGGEPVQPDGEVTFTLPDSLKDGSYTLIGEDGTETALGTENGKLTLNFQPDGQDPVQVMILKKN